MTTVAPKQEHQHIAAKATGWGSQKRLAGPVYDWIESGITSRLPPNAVTCGKDMDGSDVYIGKCTHENFMLPVKVIPRRREAYIAYKGREIPKTHYKVLVNHMRESPYWVPASNGHLPANAVQCGYNASGIKLFVGRANHQGHWVPGQVNPQQQKIYVPFAGQEHSYSNYEVLVNRM